MAEALVPPCGSPRLRWLVVSSQHLCHEEALTMSTPAPESEKSSPSKAKKLLTGLGFGLAGIVLFYFVVATAIDFFLVNEEEPIRTQTVHSSIRDVSDGMGLGVSQSHIWSVFGQPAMFPVSIQNAPLADGTPRYLGTFEDGHALLEMAGPTENLTSVTLLLDDTDEGYPFRNALYMNMLLDLTMPQWSGSSIWIATHMEEADSEGMTSTQIQGIRVTITVTESAGLLELDVRDES